MLAGAPDYGQLVDGERSSSEGREFESLWDDAGAGAGRSAWPRTSTSSCSASAIGAVPHVCRELVARDPRWRAMVEHVKTVATQAFQLWMREDMHELGWEQPPVNLSGFVEPFDTWADMSHLIPRGELAEPRAVVAYFCSVLPDALPQGDRDPRAPRRRSASAVRAQRGRAS